MQGIGWMTMEEVLFNSEGRMLTDSLSTYKVPDIYSAPEVLDCHALETEGPEPAIFKSKAMGEPPFMYGIGAYFRPAQRYKGHSTPHGSQTLMHP